MRGSWLKAGRDGRGNHVPVVRLRLGHNHLAWLQLLNLIKTVKIKAGHTIGLFSGFSERLCRVYGGNNKGTSNTEDGRRRAGKTARFTRGLAGSPAVVPGILYVMTRLYRQIWRAQFAGSLWGDMW